MNAVARDFSSTVSQNMEWTVETGAQSSSRARSLWQVGAVPQPVQALLGVLDQVLHAAVQRDRPHEKIQVIEEF